MHNPYISLHPFCFQYQARPGLSGGNHGVCLRQLGNGGNDLFPFSLICGYYYINIANGFFFSPDTAGNCCLFYTFNTFYCLQ
jgi:hypothetical protein